LPYLPKDARVNDAGAGHGWIAQSIDEQMLKISAHDFIEPDSVNSNLILSRRICFPINGMLKIGDFLKIVLDRLKLEDITYIESPNMNHFFKEKVFPHTRSFSKQSLHSIAKRLGLAVLEIASFGSKKVIENPMMSRILNFFENVSYLHGELVG